MNPFEASLEITKWYQKRLSRWRVIRNLIKPMGCNYQLVAVLFLQLGMAYNNPCLKPRCSISESPSLNERPILTSVWRPVDVLTDSGAATSSRVLPAPHHASPRVSTVRAHPGCALLRLSTMLNSMSFTSISSSSSRRHGEQRARSSCAPPRPQALTL